MALIDGAALYDWAVDKYKQVEEFHFYVDVTINIISYHFNEWNVFINNNDDDNDNMIEHEVHQNNQNMCNTHMIIYCVLA